MNKRTLIQEVAKRTGLSIRKSKVVVDCILNEFSLAVRNEGRISIRNFGSLSTEMRKGKRFYNISKQQYDYSPSKKYIKFSTYKRLRETINKTPIIIHVSNDDGSVGEKIHVGETIYQPSPAPQLKGKNIRAILR